MDRIRLAQLGPLPDVDEDVQPLLRACLARNPEERLGSAEAFRRLLSPLRRARPEAGPSELARWLRQGEPSPPPAALAETVAEDVDEG
jgi:serine/threonine-protein kinase